MSPSTWLFRALVLLILGGFVTAQMVACSKGAGNGSGGDTDTDSDSDTDSDTDTDTDAPCGSLADCSACTTPTCIAGIGGHIEDDAGDPLPGQVQICIPQCINVPIDDNGDFCLNSTTCMEFDFEGDPDPPISDEIHITIHENEETHTRYSVGYHPTQAEVSDQGADDFEYDVGTLVQFELPAGGVEYTVSGGATVADLEGLTFDLDPGAITCPDDASSCTIKALDFPLGEWTPPFVTDDLAVDALYYIAPYLHLVEGGVPIHIDPATAGWIDGDSGTVYVLGDFTTHFVDCGAEDLPLGFIVPCGTASFTGGEIVTDPLPFLGFFGLVKD
jgi:hypothetical protein